MSLFTSERLQAGVWIGIGLLALVLLYVLAPILTPFALAAILSYLLAPGADWIAARKLGKFAVPRWVGALAMILCAGLVVLGLLLILIPVLQKEVIALQKAFPAMVAKLNETLVPKLREWFGITVQLNAQTIRDLLSEQVGAQSDLIADIFKRIRAGGAALLGVAGMLLLTPVVLFYLLVDWHDFKARFEALIPRRWHAQTMGMLNEIDALLAQFLRGQLTVMAVLAVYYSVALAIAGFDTALPVGILTGLLIFIPYVGFTLGLILALLAGLLQFEPLYALLAVGLIYGVGQVVESFFLTPRLVGERIGLHPLAVIFALLAFGQVFGFFGVLAALPVSAALLVALMRLKTAYFESDFYRRSS
jgi:predicted PurR-regulated permease PerM